MTTPATALSAIAVESYKKMLLVSLLVPGRGPPPAEKGGYLRGLSGGSGESEPIKILPKYTSTIVSRHIRHAAQPYHDIVSAAQVCVWGGAGRVGMAEGCVGAPGGSGLWCWGVDNRGWGRRRP